jgi:hypothetical protein
MEVSVDRQEVYLGESISFRVEVTNARTIAGPNLADLPGFNVQSQGSQSLNSQNVQIINGRITRQETFGEAFLYSLTPQVAGTVVIPELEVVADGKTLRGKSIKVRVIAPVDQDLVIVRLSHEPESVYPLQPLTLRVQILVHRLPDGAGNQDPLQITEPPDLSVPWEPLPEGLEGEELSAWLSPLQAKSRRVGSRRVHVGFTVNGISAPRSMDPFSLFGDVFRERQAVFDLRGRSATAEDLQDLGLVADRAGDYWVYTLDRQVTAKRAGNFELGRATVKGLFADRIVAGQFKGQNIFTASPPLTVAVKNVPTENRPDSYTGGIGQFGMQVEISPQTVRVGDPMTLSVSVTGQGNLEDIAAPKIAQQPAFASAFKVYEATYETLGSRRQFTYSLRPIHADVREVPPIELSFFDVQEEMFRSISTDPLPIRVEEAEQMQTGEIVTGAPADASPSTLEAAQEGIFANITDSRALRHERLSLPLLGGYLCALLACYSLTALALFQRRRYRDDPVRIRRRAAAQRARQRLKAAAQELHSGDPTQAAGAAASALTGFLADLVNAPEAGFTPRDALGHLRRLKVSSDLIQSLKQLLDEWESLQYGVHESSGPPLPERAEQLLGSLIKDLKGGGHLS